MGFIDEASGLFDEGVSKVKGAVSNVALEQLGFVKAFCRMCQEGWQLGFHECNGGNASYRLTLEDVNTAQAFFYTSPSSWVGIQDVTPAMAQQYLLVTAAGSFMKNIADAPATYTGIIQIDETGAAWRTVWGFRDGGHPTSEISAHIAAHGARLMVTNGSCRVVYHAHPAQVAALTALLPADSRTLSNILWKSLTESVIAFPQGVGALAWMVPGSQQLAQATALQLVNQPACIWELHGVLCTGDTPDAALGMAHAIDKAAGVYLQARAAAGGDASALKMLSGKDIRAIATAYGLPLNEELLED